MEQQFSIFFETLKTFWGNLAASLPKILAALVVLFVGWLLAKMIKKWLVKGLEIVKLNKVTEKLGVEKFLQDGGVKMTSLQLIGELVYWSIMMMVLVATFDSLGLTAAGLLFNQIILFIPNIFVAGLILFVGIYLAKFVSKLLTTYLSNLEVKNSELIGNIAYYAVMVFAVFMILDQLSIAGKIVGNTFTILFGAICLALALAFGLGGKDWAAGILKQLFDDKK